MKSFMRALDLVEEIVIAVLVAAALILACVAMTGRYLFPNLLLDWTFELTIFLSTWAMFLCAARLVGVDGHVRVDSLINFFPKWLQTLCALFALACCLACAIYLVVAGYTVVEEAIRWREVTTSSLRIPLWYFYLSMPVSMALMTFHAAVRVVEHLTGTRYHTGPLAMH